MKFFRFAMKGLRASDFISVAAYRAKRKDWFKLGIEQTKVRRVLLGPHASIGFQSRDLVRLTRGGMRCVLNEAGD